MTDVSKPRYELCFGKFGAYFHDRKAGLDMSLATVWRKLNMLEDLIQSDLNEKMAEPQ